MHLLHVGAVDFLFLPARTPPYIFSIQASVKTDKMNLDHHIRLGLASVNVCSEYTYLISESTHENWSLMAMERVIARSAENPRPSNIGGNDTAITNSTGLKYKVLIPSIWYESSDSAAIGGALWPVHRKVTVGRVRSSVSVDGVSTFDWEARS